MENQNSNQILEEEKKILNETKAVLKEIKKEEADLKSIKRRALLTNLLLFLVIAGIFGGAIYWTITSKRVYIEKAEVSAPRIELAPQTPGILNDVLVNEGDSIPANTPVARVGNELIKSKIAGTIIEVHNNIGKIINPGEPVIVMIDPKNLRIIGKIEEDKGLSDIKVGQSATFSLDAFGSTEYSGVVDEISPESANPDVVFNISDKRQLKEFDVKIRYDINSHPEFKEGMSAKIWIYKN